MISVSQFVPVKPGLQLQVLPSALGSLVPLLHGFGVLFSEKSQNLTEKPNTLFSALRIFLAHFILPVVVSACGGSLVVISMLLVLLDDVLAGDVLLAVIGVVVGCRGVTEVLPFGG